MTNEEAKRTLWMSVVGLIVLMGYVIYLLDTRWYAGSVLVFALALWSMNCASEMVFCR